MITRRNANQSKDYEDSPLRQWRDAKGWSMRKLADCSGIKLGTLASLERGQYMPNTENGKKLTAVLGKDADEMLKKMLDYVYVMQARKNERYAMATANEARGGFPCRNERHERCAMQSIDGAAGYAEMAVWEEMTERGKNGVKGLDMRLVNEYDPMKSLKGLRVKARLSTWEAAKRVGIPEYQWAGIERGEEKPDIKVARKIASLFKTEWVWIRELSLK